MLRPCCLIFSLTLFSSSSSFFFFFWGGDVVGIGIRKGRRRGRLGCRKGRVG
jgi:hypothetical protein